MSGPEDSRRPRQESPRLLEFARRMADGSSMDWDLVEATASADLALLRRIRGLRKIAEARRGQNGPAGAPSARRSGAIDEEAPTLSASF